MARRAIDLLGKGDDKAGMPLLVKLNMGREGQGPLGALTYTSQSFQAKVLAVIDGGVHYAVPCA
jgi:hypothetical protein